MSPNRPVATIVGRSAHLAFPYGAEHPVTGEPLRTWVKTIDGRRWVKRDRVWVVPVDALEPGQLTRAGFLAVRPDGTPAKRSDLNVAKPQPIQPVMDDVPTWFGLDLFPYQVEGAKAVAAGRRLLADEPGIGKTRQAIAAAAILGARRTVILCPPAVIPHWVREVEQSGLLTAWSGSGSDASRPSTPREVASADPDPATTIEPAVPPGVVPRVLVLRPGRKVPELPATGVVVLSDSFVTSRTPVRSALMEWGIDVLIYDEAHRAKTWTSARSGATRELADAARCAIALTGTPIFATPVELAPILALTGKLDDFGGRKQFMSSYAKQNRFRAWVPIHGKLPELRQRLDAGVWVRRLKKDVLSDLPEKVRQVRWVEVDQAVIDDAYAKVMATVDEWVTSVLDAGEVPDREDVREWAQGNLGLVTLLRQAAGVAKAPAAGALVAEWCEDGAFSPAEDGGASRPLVVWTHHNIVTDAVIEAAQAALTRVTGKSTGVGVIRGATSAEDRQAAVDEFQAGRLPVLVCSIMAAGVGLTLTRSSDVIFVETDWTPAVMGQAEDRCIVEGQPVVTRRGGIPIEQVVVGDEVVNRDGRWTQVIDHWSRLYDGPVTTVLYVGGTTEPLMTTFDHRLWARRGGVERWVEAHQLLPGDELLTPRPSWGGGVALTISGRDPVGDRWTRCRCGSTAIVGWGLCASCYRHDRTRGLLDRGGRRRPNGRRVHLPERIPVDDDASFVIGWYLAEGFASTAPGKGRFISLSGHERERPVLEWCGRWFDRLGVNWTIYANRRTKGIELRAYSAELAYTFAENFGHASHHKRLPDGWLADISERQARILLDAYYAGDGYHRPPAHEAVTASRSLAWDVALLTERLGFRSLIRASSTTSGGHNVVGYHDYLTDGFRRVRSVGTSHGRRVRVHDLTVKDGESFMVGLAAVHNCHRLGQVRPVNYTTLIAPGTLDERIQAALVKKAKTLDAVVGGDNSVAVSSGGDGTIILIDLIMQRIESLRKTHKRARAAS